MLDHLVITASDLAGAVAWFGDTTGVEPSAGGAHPGVGTRNALAALADASPDGRFGDALYIEVIAPDPEQAEPARPRPFGIDDLGSGPQLTTFAVRPTDIEATVARLRAEADLDLGRVRSMSRTRPDGVELAWQLTDSPYPEGGGALPFLIAWGDTPHPSATAATGCGLAAFEIRHPDPDRVRAVLAVLELDVPVVAQPEPGLAVTLDTPNGAVELG